MKTNKQLENKNLKPMKTLTIGKETYEVVDETAREEIKEMKGIDNRSGSKGFTILGIDKNNKAYTLDSVAGLEVDDIYSAHVCYSDGTNTQCENYGKITAIDSEANIVTVDKLFCEKDFSDKNSPYLDSDGLDTEQNSFRIVAKPDVGTRVFGYGAHAEGLKTSAEGNCSHSEGKETLASGSASHTEGRGTTSTGDYQHVQGKYNAINKDYAHIVGNGTDNDHRSNAHTLDWNGNAWYSGKVSQEGTPTENKDLTPKKYVDDKFKDTEITGSLSMGRTGTKGSNSIALGTNVEASGRSSVAFGENSKAQGIGSVAAGTNDKNLVSSMLGSSLLGAITNVDAPIAYGDMSLSLGAGTKSYTAGTMALGANTTAGCKGFYWHSIDFTNNTIQLSTEQKPYYETTSIFGKTVNHNENPTWTDAAKTQLAKWLVGDKISMVNNSKYTLRSEITAINRDTGIITVDSLPFTEVKLTIVPIVNTLALSFDDCTVYCPSKPNVGVVDLGFGAFAMGLQNSATGSFSHAEGWNNQALNDFGHAEGRDTKAGYAAHAEGYGTSAINTAGHAEGYQTSAGYNAHSEGHYTNAMGSYSHAEGYSTILPEEEGININGTNEEIEAAWNEKKFALAKGNGNHTEGLNCLALGERSHVEGNQSLANANNAHAEGYFNKAYGHASHAEGHTTIAGIVTSPNGTDYGYAAHSEGKNTKAEGNYSHAEGYVTITGKTAAHAEGNSTKALAAQSHTEGHKTSSFKDNAHAEGYQTHASGKSSHIEGTSTNILPLTIDGVEYTNESSFEDLVTAWNTKKFSIVKGEGAHVEGTDNIATGAYAHAEGKYNLSNSSGAHTEGAYTRVIDANQGHAEGYYTEVLGHQSHAEGYNTSAHGTTSHAEGRNPKHFNKQGFDFTGKKADAIKLEIVDKWKSITSNNDKFGVAYGKASHVEGEAGLGIGDYTHTEGYQNIATGLVAHAEGWLTESNEDASHSEGRQTIANGKYSHAEGYKSKANKNYSHAQGCDTIADSNCQHVEGKWNVPDSTDKYVHIVGGGTSNTNRKNIYTLDWSGNAEFAGKISQNGTPTEDKDLTTKKYVDSNFVKNDDYATSSKGGVVKTDTGYGIGITGGKLYINSASKDDIRAKENNRRPIAPNLLDFAVKAALANPSEAWTEEEQASARTLLGAPSFADIPVLDNSYPRNIHAKEAGSFVCEPNRTYIVYCTNSTNATLTATGEFNKSSDNSDITLSGKMLNISCGGYGDSYQNAEDKYTGIARFFAIKSEGSLFGNEVKRGIVAHSNPDKPHVVTVSYPADCTIVIN